MQTEYQTQRLSLRFFMLMLVLFVVQVIYGMILAAQQVDPTILQGWLNFNVARAAPLNLGIMWIVCGFIGAILFVAALVARRALAAPWVVRFLCYAGAGVAGWCFFTQCLGERGIAGGWRGRAG